MTFGRFTYVPKTLLDLFLMNHSNERVDHVIPSQFSVDIFAYTDMTKISYFRYENIKLAL